MERPVAQPRPPGRTRISAVTCRSARERFRDAAIRFVHKRAEQRRICKIDIHRHLAERDLHTVLEQVLRAIDIDEMHADIASTTINLLKPVQRPLAKIGSKIMPGAIDNYGMGNETAPADQPGPVEIKFDTDLMRIPGIAGVASIKHHALSLV